MRRHTFRTSKKIGHSAVTRAAFTLMEVLLVLAILGVIAAMVVPQFIGRQEQASIDATAVSIKGIEQALKLYQLDHGGTYPSSSEGLQVLVTSPSNDPKWKGPYLEELPKDAWGKPFQYQYPPQHNTTAKKPDIWSSGIDLSNNTADDITNWSKSQ